MSGVRCNLIWGMGREIGLWVFKPAKAKKRLTDSETVNLSGYSHQLFSFPECVTFSVNKK